MGTHQPLRKPSLQYSLGFISLHYVIHSLRSPSVHPLPIILLALRPPSALRGFSGTEPFLISRWLMPRSAPSLCVHHSRWSFYCPPQPVALAGNSVRTSLHCLCRLATLPRLTADKCAAGLPLLLAQGCITFCQSTGERFHN